MSDEAGLDEVRLDEVGLRAVGEADLEVFFAYEHEAEAVRRAAWRPREREAFMSHWATRVLGDASVLVRTVTVDGEPAGNLVAWWEQDRRFLGYWLGRRFWGRGVGSRALTLFLRLERNRPLYADPVSGNTGSVRLLEKHGFRRTGTVRHGEQEHTMLVLDDDTAAEAGALDAGETAKQRPGLRRQRGRLLRRLWCRFLTDGRRSHRPDGARLLARSHAREPR